ncbi:MAG: hypothetical protein JXQ72_02560 [Anaerolineae bacterium]|nr:hypothetical protein [Anaerolineae bacterium]
MRDFTLAAYDALCQAVQQSGYHSLGMAEYLARLPDDRPEPCVLLRHDVDSRPAHAVKLAEIERTHGLVATYFCRTVPGPFDPVSITALAGLGHEIGYHYETLGQARGNMDQALVLFQSELDRLRQFAPVTIASMHGAPLKPWDNRAIWNHTAPQDFGLVGEVYRDLDYGQIDYFSDTGRTWHPNRYNVRDHTGQLPRHTVNTTQELIDLIRSGQITQLCLLTHPERWASSPVMWITQTARDVAINMVKVVLKRAYSLKFAKSAGG